MATGLPSYTLTCMPTRTTWLSRAASSPPSEVCLMRSLRRSWYLVMRWTGLRR